MSKEVTLIIPSGWNEVIVDQYQRIQLLDKSKYASDLTYMIDVMAILANTDKETISGVNLDNLNMLVGEMEWLNDPIPEKKIKEIKIGDNIYYWKGPFNSLTVGEMISIEQVIDIEQLNYIMAMDIILTVLLRKKKPDSEELEKFDAKLFNERRELFSTIKITDVYGMVLFFSSGARTYTSNIKVYSNNQMKKKQNILKRSWRWWKKLIRLVFHQDGNGSV